MNILSIETSCDETAVSIVRATGDFPHATYTVLGNALFSQIDIHREYGGVFPAIAKREHAKTLVPMLETALGEARLLENDEIALSPDEMTRIEKVLSREPGLSETLLAFCTVYKKPDIDCIAVTQGPGLEPALWVGINFAKALSILWNIPVIPVNHMEGHVLASIYNGKVLPEIHFPALALLISGGHTELVLMRAWNSYELLGQTRDDAVGEAFDKVARMLGLPYPGGPEISKLAAEARKRNLPHSVVLPRPMIDSADYDFSFSGLKTAVRYALEGLTQDDKVRASFAREFENAVTDVLVAKTRRGIEAHGVKTVIVGGGVSANSFIRSSFQDFIERIHPDVTLYFPEQTLSTDNAIMIALAAHTHTGGVSMPIESTSIRAVGNLPLTSDTSLL